MNRQYSMVPLLLGAALLLSGCGGGAALPTEYDSGDVTLPSLTALVSLEDKVQCSSESSEEGTSYRYTGLESPSQAVTDYRTALELDYDCVPLSSEGQLLPEDDELPATGELILAQEDSSGNGLFQLYLSWDETSCTVTPSFDEDAALPEESPTMTTEEVVQYFRTVPPSLLGLEGSDMSSYKIFCEDGLVFLDSVPCFCLNIYRSGSGDYQHSYLFFPATKEIYSLDRSTGTVQSLTS